MELEIKNKQLVERIVKQVVKKKKEEVKPAIRLDAMREQREHVEFNKIRLVYDSVF